MSARRLAPALAVLILSGCPRLDPMQRQAKYKAYQASTETADGLAMRSPPEGTVPYGALLDPAVLTGLGPDGKPLPLSPLKADEGLLARGRARFDVECAVCHGLLGDGESQVALNMSLRRPPSLHQYRDLTDGYLYQVITQGFGLMPSYASVLPVEDRWAVVAYVRALQLSQHFPAAELPASERGELTRSSHNRPRPLTRAGAAWPSPPPRSRWSGSASPRWEPSSTPAAPSTPTWWPSSTGWGSRSERSSSSGPSTPPTPAGRWCCAASSSTCRR